MSQAILLIEDEPLLRNAYELMLSEQGYTVHTADNGYEALRVLERHPRPGLILLDMLMPKLDGLGFLRQAELGRVHPGSKVVVFSNFSKAEDWTELRQYGVSERLLKSKIGPAELLEVVKRYLAE